MSVCHISTKQLILTVRWIPSHLSEKLSKDPNYVIPEFVSKLDIKANGWADKHAGKAAHSAEVLLNVSTPCLYRYHFIRSIPKKLVIILCTLPDRPKHIPKAKIPKEDLCTIIAASKHLFFGLRKMHVGLSVQDAKAPCTQNPIMLGHGSKGHVQA